MALHRAWRSLVWLHPSQLLPDAGMVRVGFLELALVKAAPPVLCIAFRNFARAPRMPVAGVGLGASAALYWFPAAICCPSAEGAVLGVSALVQEELV